ncbi:MAG: ATP-binding protein [Candidatus Symbiothrix sp.]|jgi:AAA+ ATPase superfamily predicted ATPase|nr:ATP-binding protein [Candidatus Symbiothrix sp.]
MEKNINPFPTIGYETKKYFCNRENEVATLRRNMENGINTTLISTRRIGKSALIYRLFEDLEVNRFACVYVDIYACTCLKDFTEALALAIFTKFPEKRTIGKRFFDFLKGLHPVISYDALNGQPEIRFEFSQTKEYEHTLRSLLVFLDSQQVEVVLALDEFQQIADFPEKNVEALLRTVIQTLKNSRFIFSGSKKHLMLEMFNTANRPFFSSTQTVGLSEIPTDKYATFIHEKFAERNRTIDDDAVDFILSWTLSHTFYTQTICRRTFAEGKRRVDIQLVKHICDEQLNLQQTTFMQYRNLLSPVQWQLLLAVAKEGLVTEPQSQAFLRKYKIGAASSAKKALQALIDKEMVCTIEMPNKTAYRVYNVFLMRWMERMF